MKTTIIAIYYSNIDEDWEIRYSDGSIRRVDKYALMRYECESYATMDLTIEKRLIRYLDWHDNKFNNSNSIAIGSSPVAPASDASDSVSIGYSHGIDFNRPMGSGYIIGTDPYITSPNKKLLLL